LCEKGETSTVQTTKEDYILPFLQRYTAAFCSLDPHNDCNTWYTKGLHPNMEIKYPV